MKHLLTALVFVLFLASCSDSAGPQATNRDPVITSALTATPPEGEAPLSVAFSLAATDPDGDTLSYNWDFDGDDQIDDTTTEPGIENIEFAAGTHEVSLEVSDGKGGAVTTSVTVSAREPDPF